MKFRMEICLNNLIFQKNGVIVSIFINGRL
nr:MAG TPA: hypothetical protein [Caudoviricetes sp.]